jgi:flagellar basal body rod protein FlgG
VNVGLYQAAAALDADQKWQDTVSDNLAYGSLTGYKRQELSFAAMQEGLMPYNQPGQKNEAQTFVVPMATSGANFESGELKPTKVNTDVAIDGKGFFEVKLPTGEVLYTRDGDFHVNTAAQLVTKEGYPVLGMTAGAPTPAPIQLSTTSHSQVSISTTGEVSQDDGIKGKLKLANFDKPGALTPATGSYFMADPKQVKEVPTNATLRQGYLEGSNVSSVTEMVSLLTAMRSYESNAKVIQMEDDHMGHAIQELGNPN